MGAGFCVVLGLGLRLGQELAGMARSYKCVIAF